ncbi:WD40/YVTN/BNR-like repeat-containing protein [Paenibacillus pini]|uniref:Sortilin N-terminal domain-containing protein n=1 Tax=Paenibacillus pini JCM 16418 TaxID=1236976 RepID=W7YG57_9BACL|nr:hypothetical protein [Paenibacillus pini]GAF07457.1 hypothetical protein JCM16418_1473 [Paenibacillus pini JCM 16418]
MTIWHKLIGSSIIISLLLTGCSSSSTIEEASAPVLTEPTEQGQTLNVVTPDTTKKNTDAKSKYQIQTRLTDFQLITETSGIAWGLTRNSMRMYLTQDNGKTWSNISPAANILFSANPRYGKDIFFKDKMNGWIVRSASGTSETIVLHTTDGGENWNITSIPQTSDVSALFFNSSKRGWLLTSSNMSAGKEDKTLYRTDDGGSLWKVQMLSKNNSVQSQGQVNKVISQNGYTIGMSFFNATQGFVMVQDLGEPKLYTTNDAGSNWTIVPKFFNREKLGVCTSYNTAAPQLLSADNKEAWIPIGCNLGKNTKYNGYFTSDGGKTWTFTLFNMNWNTGVNKLIRPTFLNNKEGWSLHGSTLYHTLNQGKTWTALPESDILKKNLVRYPEVVKIQFQSSNVGWMLIEKSDERRSLLMQTKDGGITWNGL